MEGKSMGAAGHTISRARTMRGVWVLISLRLPWARPGALYHRLLSYPTLDRTLCELRDCTSEPPAAGPSGNRGARPSGAKGRGRSTSALLTKSGPPAGSVVAGAA